MTSYVAWVPSAKIAQRHVNAKMVRLVRPSMGRVSVDRDGPVKLVARLAHVGCMVQTVRKLVCVKTMQNAVQQTVSVIVCLVGRDSFVTLHARLAPMGLIVSSCADVKTVRSVLDSRVYVCVLLGGQMSSARHHVLLADTESIVDKHAPVVTVPPVHDLMARVFVRRDLWVRTAGQCAQQSGLVLIVKTSANVVTTLFVPPSMGSARAVMVGWERYVMSLVWGINGDQIVATLVFVNMAPSVIASMETVNALLGGWG